ncbi:MAG: NTF2-like N-terminal transpeptidase domain-containing protein, partial [Candidatus Promineifilaceae bacterium]
MPEPTSIPAVTTPTPALPVTPTPSDSTEAAATAALAYFHAWEVADYLQMYNLLSPDSQARIDSRSFVTFYEEAMATAAVEDIRTELLGAARNGDRAELGFRVVWQTTVFGEIVREHQVQLVNNQERWRIN